MTGPQISLDPPYRVGDAELTKTFSGWCTVEDESSPDIGVGVDGAVVPFELFDFPEARDYLQRPAIGVRIPVDFQAFFAGRRLANSPGGFLLNVCVSTDGYVRNFEYAVTQAWLDALFPGSGVRARPVPPEHLQIRIAGAAAGGFYASAAATVTQIEAVLRAAGFDLKDYRRMLDFGCGSGRLMAAMRERHPGATLTGSDIDAEAVAWCRDNLGELATFDVNGNEPPTRYAGDSFDLIYSISLFTHLPEEMQFAWLDEMRRILRPGGLLITTILNPAAYALPEEVGALASAAGIVYHGAAPATDGLPEFYRLTYHTHEYVARAWASYFEVLRIGRSDLNDTQDSVLCRKR
jgi:SAM-dependent methyltransferase